MGKEGYIEIDKLLIVSAKYVITRLKKIIIFLTIGVLIGTFNYIFTPKVFSASFVIDSPSISLGNIKELLKDLHELIEERNYNELSKYLGITAEEASKLSDIDFYDVQRDIEEKEEKNISMGITFNTQDTINREKVRDGIINCLSNSQYLTTRIKLRLKLIDSSLKSIDSEIMYLNRIKSSLESQVNALPGPEIVFDFGGLSERNVMLLEKKNKMMLEKNSLVYNIIVSKNLTNFRKHVKPKLMLSLIFGLLLSGFVFFVSEIFAFFIKNRARIDSVELSV
jgi:hypothetical protein